MYEANDIDFEIRPIKPYNHDSEKDGTTVNLTLRKITYRIENPTDPIEDPYTARIDGVDIIQLDDETDDEGNIQTNEFTIDEYIDHLHTKMELVKSSFYIGNALMASYIFFVLSIFDQKRIFWYTKLSVISIGLWISLEEIFKWRRLRRSQLLVSYHQKLKMHSFIRFILFCVLSSYLTLYFAQLSTYDSRKLLLVVPTLSLSVFTIIFLIYSATCQVDVLTNIFLVFILVLGNAILLQYSTKLLGTSQTRWESICWPLWIGIVFFTIWFSNILKLINMMFKYLGDAILLAYILVQVYFTAILLFISTYCITGMAVNFTYIKGDNIFARILVLAGSFVGLIVTLSYPIAVRSMTKEIERFEQFKEEKCKVKITVPYFLVS